MGLPAPKYSFHFRRTLNRRESNLRNLNKDVTSTLLCILVTGVLVSRPGSGGGASSEN